MRALNIQWYPGHMTKTSRMIAEHLKYVDLAAEVIDARIPVSSRNPALDQMLGDKPRLIVCNRMDQADPEQTRRWCARFRSQGWSTLETDAKTGAGVRQFPGAARAALREQIARWREKGQTGRPVRVMVVGIPNVGKSAFINQVARRKSAKAGNRPGVTRGRQWVSVDAGLELLDMPGILWPKFDDPTVGLHLAFTGAVKDEVMDQETLGCRLMELLAARYPGALAARYRIETDGAADGWTLLERAARKRGFLVSGGEADLERMAKTLLDEYRAGKLGRFTLETPDEQGGADCGSVGV